MKELELNVEGMECIGCENRIKNAVLEIKEVREVRASHETGNVHIVLKKEITEEIKNNIIETIERMEFEVRK